MSQAMFSHPTAEHIFASCACCPPCRLSFALDVQFDWPFMRSFQLEDMLLATLHLFKARFAWAG
jgi:hypothetical protein